MGNLQSCCIEREEVEGDKEVKAKVGFAPPPSQEAPDSPATSSRAVDPVKAEDLIKVQLDVPDHRSIPADAWKKIHDPFPRAGVSTTPAASDAKASAPAPEKPAEKEEAPEPKKEETAEAPEKEEAPEPRVEEVVNGKAAEPEAPAPEKPAEKEEAPEPKVEEVVNGKAAEPEAPAPEKPAEKAEVPEVPKVPIPAAAAEVVKAEASPKSSPRSKGSKESADNQENGTGAKKKNKGKKK
eukprot:TRINITY_DN9612_c0_g1_i1.p1 TRINITY_DN9612_c0_g1~~TRINITY_DN9612_c0_g1_i1.p1  ORF type:complete len:239 (+),score=111.19 TRINITY_DN9612_c0_g1_i1:63-779(+)